MIHKFINSKILIAKVYDEYNIQSDDFTSRLPNWTYNVLRQIKVKQVYVIKNIQIEYDNNKIYIPQYIDKVYGIKINGVLAKPIFSDEIRVKTKMGNSPVMGIDGTLFPTEKNIMEFITTNTESTSLPEIEDSIFTQEVLSNMGITKTAFDMQYVNQGISEEPTYKINNGWIHTNIEYGTCEIICGTIPFEYDSELDMIFPLIPDDEYLKEAITQYCLMNMLRRGLKHHTLTLQANNRYVNPAQGYDYFIPKARNSCNSLSPQAKESLSKILNITLL